MPEEVIDLISKYGYLAIFILVFLQETGMPNPLPNELLLMFTGYLSFKGFLNLPLVITTVILADLAGSNLLYFIFYKTGIFIVRKLPSWLPVPEKLLHRMHNKLSNGHRIYLFIFRLTPFTRGYTSVIAGLLRIKTKIFIPLTIASTVVWASFYIIAGRIIAPWWDSITGNNLSIKWFMLLILCIAAVIAAADIIRRRLKLRSKSTDLQHG